MRLATLATGLFLAFSAAVAAQPYETPEALIEAIYQPYTTGNFPEDDSVFRSRALQGLYSHDAEITPEGEVGASDFDPFVDGQDYELTDLEIGAAGIAGDYASVDVTFNNMGEPRALSYELVREDGGWKVDDVSSTLGEFPWRLTELFAMASGGQ
jgi:hypothetical protein